MPLRLLGIFSRLEDALLLCGGTLARCAESGIETMAVSLTCGAGPSQGASRAARLLSVSQLVYLDFGEALLDDIDGDSLREAIGDLLRSFQPDVVVTPGPGHARNQAAHAAITAAFRQAQRAGSDSRPARLYWTTDPGDLDCTTVLDVRSQLHRKLDAIRANAAEPAPAVMGADANHEAQPLDREFYIRAHPRPWVTGIVERGLFGGLAERAASVLRAAA